MGLENFAAVVGVGLGRDGVPATKGKVQPFLDSAIVS